METWSIIQQEKTWSGQGNQAWLNEALTASFHLASARARPSVLRWTGRLDQARGRQPVVGGFHSPLEQSVLLQARCPVVAVLARPVAWARLPPECSEPLVRGRMAAASAVARSGRLTEALAAQRNEWVTALARQIVVAHVSPGGRLAVLCDEWTRAGGFVR